MRDTIFALATAPGRAAVAVVRLSGPDSNRALAALGGRLPAPRSAALRVLKDPLTGERLDQALALRFSAPASFTGEDQAELHLHGGRAVVDAVLHALSDLGLRQAEPGEFTRRAFENGKLDLLEAEGVADLIDAETQAQRRQALGQLRGALRGREAHWRSLLIDALALLEASIDFPDEDVPDGVVDQARCALGELSRELAEALADARGERVRDGFRVAILGRPNAGKSSLLNAMAGRDAAIVTPVAGTTRDIIEVALDVAGYRVTLADTAGLRDTTDVIEAEGVRRAKAWAKAAALRLFVVDSSEEDNDFGPEAMELLVPNDVVVLNKIDKANLRRMGRWRTEAKARALILTEASASLKAIGAVEGVLKTRVIESLAGADAPAVTRFRHRLALETALTEVQRALAPRRAPELMAEDVRLTSTALARLSGRVGAEDVLDKVFGSFCIGK